MLTWPAVDGSKHRVYLSDQQGLRFSAPGRRGGCPGWRPHAARGGGVAGGCSTVARSTAQRFAADRIAGGGRSRRGGLHHLVAAQPGDGAEARSSGPDGAEPPFDSCGIVAVAVPDSRGPVAPRIDGHVDPATGARTLRVVTDGFDRSALQRDELGLFDPGVAGTEPPRFRIRRAVGPVADPVYARVLREGPMQILNSAATPAVFEATFLDDGGVGRGLEPFVRYVYWAEVRLPPERRIPAESPCSTHRGASPCRIRRPGKAAPTTAQPTVGAARPDAPASQPSRTGPASTQSPSRGSPETPWTRNSPSPWRTRPDRTPWRSDPYRAAIWYQWPGHTIRPAVAELAWPELSDGVVPIVVKVPVAVDPDAVLGLRVAFVDPAGRIGEIASLNV